MFQYIILMNFQILSKWTWKVTNLETAALNLKSVNQTIINAFTMCPLVARAKLWYTMAILRFSMSLVSDSLWTMTCQHYLLRFPHVPTISVIPLEDGTGERPQSVCLVLLFVGWFLGIWELHVPTISVVPLEEGTGERLRSVCLVLLFVCCVNIVPRSQCI